MSGGTIKASEGLPVRPPSTVPTEHPLAGPLGVDEHDDGSHVEEITPASFQSQGTLRAAWRKESQSGTVRPGYFDLQRLAAAQSDAASSTAAGSALSTRNRRSPASRVTSIYAASNDGDDGAGRTDPSEKPSALLTSPRQLSSPSSPLQTPVQPHPVTRALDFSHLTPSNNDPAAPRIGDSHADDGVSHIEGSDPVVALERRLHAAEQEADKWRKRCQDQADQHAKDVKALAKATRAREDALLGILTAAGISKARADRALMHATEQSQVPVIHANDRAAETSAAQAADTAQGPDHADQLPASLMEAMLDDLHADSPAHHSRSESPAPSVQSASSRAAGQPGQPNSATSSSSVGSFFTLGWRRRRPTPRAAKDEHDTTADVRSVSPIISTAAAGSAAATLNKTLHKNNKRTASGRKSGEPNVTRLPGMFRQPSMPAPTAADESTGASNANMHRTESPIVTQELEPMLAHDVRPPTLNSAAAVAKRRTMFGNVVPERAARRRADDDEYQSSGDEFEEYGGKHLSPEELAEKMSSTIRRRREQGTQDDLLTDRYGFVYDATPTDVRLLRRARKEAVYAPATLTGIRVSAKARGESDSESHSESEAANDVSESDPDATPFEDTRVEFLHRSGDSTIIRKSLKDAVDLTQSATIDAATPSPSIASAGAPGFLELPTSKPTIGSSRLNAASQSSQSAGPTSPEEERLHFLGQDSAAVASSDATLANKAAAAPSGNGTPHSRLNASHTVRRLLHQLREMHNKQQDEQQLAWDAFLQRRRLALRKKNEQTIRAGSMAKAFDAVRKSGDALGLTAATASMSKGSSASAAASPVVKASEEEELTLGGLVGLSQLGASSKDRAEFRKMIFKGVPLVYRAKIWYECSGALDLAEPGRYQELLDEHAGEENTCTRQIDLDIGRTMPTNIYFAGDGPGVAKLRRLLVAFSWYNPGCGYCQGMNNLAATLLLTHATEEEAFWVFVSLIEHILPDDYFNAHLIIAQADQRVLVDYIRKMLPKLHRHLHELGVDLPAVTFAWFLSLYTDCLPVETLFRVWDVLFVEGMVVLFRVAIAVFIINEKELLATQSPSAFYSAMHGITSRLFSAERLIALACEDLPATVKMEKINQRRAKHVKDLRTELGLASDDDGAGDDADSITGASSNGRQTPSVFSVRS